MRKSLFNKIKTVETNDIYIFGFKINFFEFIAILAGIFFLVVGWILALLQNGFSFTFQNLVKIHKDYHVIVIDSAPFVLWYLAHLLVKIVKKREDQLNNLIELKDIEYKSLRKFTEAIGKGNLDIQPDEIMNKSELGRLIVKMRDDLLENKRIEEEQKWINEGKELVSAVLRKYNDLEELSYNVLVEVLKFTGIVQGAFYIYDEDKETIISYATYAYSRKKLNKKEFKIGEGLVGEAVFEKDTIYRIEIPEDYATFTSGLIEDKKPNALLIEPLVYNEKVEGVLEVADIKEIDELKRRFIKEIGIIIAQTLFNLKVNYKTKMLLDESQKMMEQLRESEEELRQNAEEMRATQEVLEETNKKLEEQIKEVENSQRRLELLLENASEVISIYDRDLVLVYESQAALKILGYDPKELIGKRSIYDLEEYARQPILDAIDKIKDSPGDSETIRFQYEKPNSDEKIWLEVIIRNLLNAQGINGFLFNTRDVTPQIIAELEQRRRGQMQSLSENSPDMIVRFSPDGEFFYTNPSFRNLFGLDLDEIKEKTYKDIELHSQLKEFLDEALDETKKAGFKKVYDKEFIIDDVEYFFNINVIPENNENGEIESFLVILHDITESKLFEREIEYQNKKITESINYAHRIQKSLLPDQNTLRNYFEKSFLVYKPKDVISGDFPWIFERNNYLYVAAVDCTGHGVPGALLSFIGYFHLNNIVDHDRILSAGEILDLLHHKVRTTLKQNVPGATTRDGMDIALLKIKLGNGEIEYAGAHRPLYLVRDGELIEYKGDRKAIGGIPHRKKFEKNFTNHEINVKKEDRLFIFTDGYPDQINENMEKFKNKRIKEMILNNNDKPMYQLGNLFIQEINNWKGTQKQIDDILFIGIEF
jgi:PAS domain S-box-containing protein